MSARADTGRSAFRNILRNFVTLLGGRAVGGLLAFAATVISARELGATGFGLVALVHAYVLIVRGLLNVKPFEAVVRFGIPLIDDGNQAGFGRLLRTCFAIDLGSAALATATALAVAPLLAELGVWPHEITPIALAYSLSLIASGQATASGVLRVYDRYAALSRALVISNGVRLIGVLVVCYVLAPTVSAIAAVWAASLVVQYALTQWLGWRTVRRQIPERHLFGAIEFSAVGAAHPGIWRFLHVVYWQSSLDLVPKPVGTLLAGTLLGPDAAALFRIAREVGNVVAKPALLARQAIYPDLARLRHRNDGAFGRIVLSVAVLLALPALAATALAAWHGEALLGFVLGESYAPGAVLLTWFVGAAALELAAAPLRPAAYTLARAGDSLRIQLVAALVYLALYFALTPALGLTGPGIATLAMATITLLGSALIVRNALVRTAQRTSTPPPG